MRLVEKDATDLQESVALVKDRREDRLKIHIQSFRANQKGIERIVWQENFGHGRKMRVNDLDRRSIW